MTSLTLGVLPFRIERHRLDRVLRSAPHLFVQSKGVVGRRLVRLRAVLDLDPSPESEEVRRRQSALRKAPSNVYAYILARAGLTADSL